MVEHQFVCLWTTFNRRKMGKTVTHQIRPLLHHLYSPHHNITRHLQIVEQTSHHPSSRPFKTQRKRYIWYNPVFASNHSQQSKLITIARDLDPFDLEWDECSRQTFFGPLHHHHHHPEKEEPCPAKIWSSSLRYPYVCCKRHAMPSTYHHRWEESDTDMMLDQSWRDLADVRSVIHRRHFSPKTNLNLSQDRMTPRRRRLSWPQRLLKY